MQHNRLDTHGGALGYAYDNCGALRRDYNKAVTQITYDLLGNPKKVKFYGGNTTEYVYTADGIRLKTIHTTVVPGSTSSSTSQNEILSVDSTVYIGDYIEENGKFKQYNFSKKRYSMKYFFLCFCLALMPIQEIGAQRGNTISERQELSSTYALLQGVWNIYKCDSTVYVKHLTFSDSIMLINTIYTEFTEYSHSVDYRYYVSDSLPEEFEYAKLGKNASGKYIIFQRVGNVKKHNYGYYRIDKLQDGELQLFMKGVERSILFPDQDIYLRKIENNYSRGANNGSSSRSSNDSSNGLNNGNSRGSGSGGGRR